MLDPHRYKPLQCLLRTALFWLDDASILVEAINRRKVFCAPEPSIPCSCLSFARLSLLHLLYEVLNLVPMLDLNLFAHGFVMIEEDMHAEVEGCVTNLENTLANAIELRRWLRNEHTAPACI